jgi:hypothetical protein
VAHDAEGPPEVRDDGIPLLDVHVREHPVTEDACVVHDDVQSPECVDRLVDHSLGLIEVRDAAAVDDRLAAELDDLVDDPLRRGSVGPLATHVCAEVVDHDLRAMTGQ